MTKRLLFSKSIQNLIRLFFLLIFSSGFAQTVYYANSATGNDANAGTIGAPFKTFHKAYIAASSGDIINLTGTFDWSTVDEIGDVSSTGYTISKNISIEGNNASTTIIQAANADNIADRRVFTFSLGYAVVINNCTIRFGKTSDGGGIQVDGSSTINNCDVSYNRASGSGGGINCRGNVHIINSLVSNNFAFYMGGGVNRDYYSGNGGTPGSSNTLIITNTTIAYNQVLSTLAYMEGGGVFFRRGIGTITNSIIAYNKVTNVDSSTNGLGTGDPSAVVNLKNNIIANNFRYNCWSGDIGHRESSNSGTYVDNGNNIFGVKGYWSQGLSVSATSWLDHVSNCSTPDGVFVLQDGLNCRSGQLFLATVLAQNSTLNNIKNFEITDQASIAINNGSDTLNLSTSIPNLDMRGFSRIGNVDIGSIEYQSVVAPFVTPVAGSASSSQSVCYNSMASDITLSGYTGSIQWQQSANGTTGWANVTGATNPILTSTEIGTLTGTKYFRANVSNSGCTVSSNPLVSITVTALPATPTTVTTMNYCQGTTATALTATALSGNTVQWYSVSTGGTASTIAPTPNTNSAGVTTYYVSQLNSTTNCESTRAAITVTVNQTPSSPVATATFNYCQGATATTLTATVTTGHTLQWYTVSTGGTASTTAPTPLTTTVGSTIYYVSQKNNTTNCESPRTAITVNVNAIPTISGVQNMTVGGNTLQLTGSGTPNTTTPWASSNTSVATISSTGVVTAVGGGAITITYTTASGCSITSTLKVVDCAAPFGNAMSFDGTNDYVSVGNTLENLADVTEEAWVYWRGSTNAFSEIFTKDLVSAFAITSTNKLHANFGNGTTWDSGLNSTASIPLNTWTHVAVTRQSGVVKMFINGKQDSATTTMNATGQNSSHRVIGAKLGGTSLVLNSAINGKIDEVRFWSSARTQAQIQASMNTELAGNESGLLAYYTFNHGIAGGNNASVNTIVNVANSASNGTIINSDKTGTNSNLVVGVTANFSISGAAIICANNTSQYTHPIAGGAWSVSIGATATISNTGLLTSTAGETVTISYTYTLNGCSLTDTKSVTIQMPVISGLSTIGIGDQITLTATTPASSNAWVSSNTTVATISNLGVVNGLTLGTTTITFTNTNGCTATQTITVVAGATQSPVLTSPAANTTGATTLNISYTLPETPLAGTVKLIFTPSVGGSPIIWTMTNATSVTFSHIVGTDPLVANSNIIISGAALSFATYNLTLSYQDASGNPVAQVTNANIQTLAPPSISFSNTSYQGIVNASLAAIIPINTGGTSTYSISPSLPNGVLISSVTGTISGTPTLAITTRQYTVTATNAAGNSSVTFNLFIDSDTDGDGIGNTTDLDIDGDGVPNSVEIQQGTSPTNPTEARDTDGDGVPDYVEQQQGTSPTIPGAQDTDGDGVPDYVEQQQGTSPTTPGAQDTDGDGVPNYVEQQQGTSPTTPGAQDTDGDGVPDYVEQQQGTSPTNPTEARDTDGDGVPDYVEQQQGTSPTIPGNTLLDTDGDGVPDYVERQQGTSPTTPGAQDTDGDGVPDYVEQQQGTSPTTPGAQDTDGDGVPDYVEQQQGTSPTIPGNTLLDTDGDGVPDYVEQQQGTSPTTPGAQDTDGDGVPDYVEQQQGTSPTTPGAQDTDGDGVPDYVEQQQGTSPTNPTQARDTDGDGVPDYVEQQQGTSPTIPGDTLLDTDGDGVPNYVETQQGTSPTTSGAQDTDGDGVPDYIEQQQGTSPTTPGAQDTDGDGVPDYVEQQQGTSPTTPGAQDTDGDGVPDYIEQQQGTSPTTPGDILLDTDGDGVPNYVEQQQGTSPTTPGAQDTDGDGVPDYIEQQQGTSPTTPGAQDTDGDGVPDYIEQQQGTSPTTPGDILLDTDGDGVPNYVEHQQGTNPTIPGDTLLDTDGDGVPNYVELQQGTNPTIPGARDTDGDGVPDYVENQQGTSPTTPGAQDTDGDGVPNYIELQQGTNPNQAGAQDTDGDGVPDYVERQQGTSPTTPGDTLLDTDDDGVPNYIEVQQGTNPRLPGAQDTDGDGVPDYIELQQGTNPAIPGDGKDTDGDGVPDYIELQQGTNPTVPGAIDTDGDGIPDYIEFQQGTNPNVSDATDSDHDGISNYREGYNYSNPSASLDTDRDGTPDYLDLDSDGDGILDVNDAFPLNRAEWSDTDHDGIGNNVDTDDDNDGILDTCDVDVNGDRIPDNGTDLDGDGSIDSCDLDMDGDGVNNTSDNCPATSNKDQSDRDHDGKGDVCDIIELNAVQALTPNGDGINDTWVIYNLENHPHSTVRVFNSNGTQVFYSSNYQNNWTGNYQGSSEMLPVGSYMFQIDLGGDGTIDSQGWMYITK